MIYWKARLLYFQGLSVNSHKLVMEKRRQYLKTLGLDFFTEHQSKISIIDIIQSTCGPLSRIALNMTGKKRSGKMASGNNLPVARSTYRERSGPRR